ncbi:hypothetical protein [Phycicoccus sonneratiae]|uniref:Uncharacterized protein n=1 Tax=Phycicoccus sonneratiae TaxID=2807628 RepID=A0ABS2CHF2_9MICO|nr:hypothetical protein [Phycicoccus sonneraticus]MBM6399299.1 hypothetical protein [Phycicoccus sonneraticus]
MHHRPTVRALAALAAAASLAVAGAGTASAKDKTMVLKKADGTVVVRATWDDLTDNLCVTVYGGSGAWGEVGIASHYGLPEPDRAIRSAANTGGAGRYCTGNLSIREDALYDMQLRWESPSRNWLYSKKETFYT